MTNDAVRALGCAADVSEVFSELYWTLFAVPAVQKVSSLTDLRREQKVDENTFRTGRTGFRLEWYMTADLTDGRCLEFAEEVSWHPDEWVVEGAVRMVDGSGEESDLVEMPVRYAVELDDLCVQALGHARQLQRHLSDLLRNGTLGQPPQSER